MNIAIVSQNVSPGILIFRKDLIESLVNSGNTVFAFAIDYTAETRAKVKELGAIPVDYSLVRAGVNPLRDIIDTYKLSKKLRNLDLDLVFSFFVKPSIYATLAAKVAGVPRRIAMLEGLGFIHTPDRNGFTLKKRMLQVVQGGLVSISYAFADKVIFLNPDDPVDLAKKALVNKNKLYVLGPIGIDLKSYSYVPVNLTAPVRFIFVGRLLSEKGIFEYLTAANVVKKKHPTAEFMLLGGFDNENPSGLSRKELQEEVDKGTVIYLGHVDTVPEYMASSHVFVLPSYREGISRSTQEAMAIGRAIITTDVPGCRETVVDGENGFLVPPWDPDALAKKMIHFLENKKDIERMGWNSFCIAQERFDVKKINKKLIRLLGVNV